VTQLAGPHCADASAGLAETAPWVRSYGPRCWYVGFRPEHTQQVGWFPLQEPQEAHAARPNRRGPRQQALKEGARQRETPLTGRSGPYKQIGRGQPPLGQGGLQQADGPGPGPIRSSNRVQQKQLSHRAQPPTALADRPGQQQGRRAASMRRQSRSCAREANPLAEPRPEERPIPASIRSVRAVATARCKERELPGGQVQARG